jgi:hypothetical protein
MKKIALLSLLLVAGCNEPDLPPNDARLATALGALTCDTHGGFDSDWKSHKAYLAYRQGYEGAGCHDVHPRGQ